ncbi:MAG: hypothetical protein HOM14_17555 [Gammaproteobacteria bacterium]|jgi:hypothetical protein|nr:hypothetical protein [Gammaproteobacteria bacterium]MBT4860338.1 hypothetical protein [Gammaproteobacteria bacterium]MBT6553160.1 hypothetical protein [Gammaproteobacteria bacterium]MBT6701915.1 hypothetical protein [Gammaproteobacteria bacterium]MBT7047432.1 hypothetical protein [Gammaproteobacteria bacterium]
MLTTLEKLNMQKGQIQARIDKLKFREKEANRKAETRRKIVAGAAFLKFISETKNEPIAHQVWSACLQRMNEKDKSLFTNEIFKRNLDNNPIKEYGNSS